jgi:hypothetical protein
MLNQEDCICWSSGEGKLCFHDCTLKQGTREKEQRVCSGAAVFVESPIPIVCMGSSSAFNVNNDTIKIRLYCLYTTTLERERKASDCSLFRTSTAAFATTYIHSTIGHAYIRRSVAVFVCAQQASNSARAHHASGGGRRSAPPRRAFVRKGARAGAAVNTPHQP